jgi:hypothetical protein
VIYVIVASLVGWAAFLSLARRKAPPRYRRLAVWVGAAWLCLESGVLLSTVAQQRHWTLHHSVLGVAALLLPVAGMACVAIAALAWRQARTIALSSQEPADS